MLKKVTWQDSRAALMVKKGKRMRDDSEASEKDGGFNYGGE